MRVNFYKTMKKYFILISLIFIMLFSVQDCFSQSGWIVSHMSNNEYFYSIDFIDENTGFLMNSSGTVYVSVNKGVSWNSYLIFSGHKPYSAHFFDFYNYVISGTLGYGAGWVVLINNSVQTHYYFYPGPSFSYQWLPATDWINQDTGFAGGSDYDPFYTGRLFRTTNKGTNWTEITPSSCYHINCIKFINANTGYVLSTNLYKTTDLGDNWTLLYEAWMSHTTSDMSVINEDTIYLAGSHGNIVMTANGGTNWYSRNIGIDRTINKIRFINSKTGWICGDGGLIMKTTNAGINWQNQYTGTTKSIRDLYVLNENYLWASGDSGVVLRTTTGGATFINNNTIEKPDKYELYQNYPNPFNANTIIRFQVSGGFLPSPRDGNDKVVLKVFDLMGREVVTLVDEKLNSGTYEVRFDAKNLPSGIYFYRMQTEIFSQTKKLILLK